MKKIFLLLMSLKIVLSGNTQITDTIYLWPGNVPGETQAKQVAKISDNHDGNVIRIAEVTNPMLVAYHPKVKKHNASMIICPGGGYQILAINHEGYEIAEWCNSMGITAYVLQYRVPQKIAGALQDAQRAIRMVKQLNPNDKVGIMGFSAGGSLSARAATMSEIESYTAIDDADKITTQLDFAALIYPAYLDQGENRALTPELTISDKTPPMFIFETADDPYGNSALVMATAMRDNKRPVELHILATGGHGYGMRLGSEAAETWPILMEKWLIKQIQNN